MLLNVLELVMMMLYVITRIAGTIAIVWLIVTWKNYDAVFLKFFLIVITLFVGLAFNVHYDNPNNHKCDSQQIEETK